MFQKEGVLFAQTHSMAMLLGFNQSLSCFERIWPLGGALEWTC